jgi:hypothetical protein
MFVEKSVLSTATTSTPSSFSQDCSNNDKRWSKNTIVVVVVTTGICVDQWGQEFFGKRFGSRMFEIDSGAL